MENSNLFCVKAFILIAENKCLTRTATQLGVSEHVLQLVIKKLERKYDVTLLDWESFKVRLTEQGKNIYEYFKLFDDELDILREEINESSIEQMI